MYTTKGKNKKLDKVTMFVGLCVPLVTLPQLYTVLTANNLQGASLFTWSFYSMQAALFAYFGIKHKEKPLIFTYIPLFVVQFAIVLTLLCRKF